MNADIRTLALTKAECLFLQRLLEFELPGEVHAVVTAALTDTHKSETLVDVFMDFHTLLSLLTWQETDEERAYRQLNTEGVHRVREILAAISPGMLPSNLQRAYTRFAPTIMEAITKALAEVPDVPLTAVSMDSPVAKA